MYKGHLVSMLHGEKKHTSSRLRVGRAETLHRHSFAAKELEIRHGTDRINVDVHTKLAKPFQAIC